MISEVKDAAPGRSPQNQGKATESSNFNLDSWQGKMQAQEHKTEPRRADHAEDQISQEVFIDLNTNQITIQQQLEQQKL